MNSARTFKNFLGCGVLAALFATSIHTAEAQTTKTWNGTANTDWFNATNWIPAGVPAANDTVNFNSGTITFTAPVTISGQFNWSGGTLDGNPLTVATNGVMSLIGSGNKFFQNTLTNAGTITFAGSGDLYLYNNLSTYKGAIYNLPGALFDIQTDRNFNCGCLGKELFNNAGLLRKSAGIGTSGIAIPLTNSGTVTTLQGTLNFNNGGLLGGTYNAAAGSVINFNGGAFTYQANALPQLNGPGGTRFTGGTLTFIDNSIPNLALVGGTLTLSPNFQGGTITNLATGSTLSGNYSVSGILSVSNGASGGLQLLSGSIVNWSGGDLTGSSQVGAGAALNWSAGTLLGPLTVATNGTLNLVGSGNKFLENALTNAGSIAFGGSGDLYFYNNLGTYKGAIFNLTGALFDIQADRNFNCGCYGSELFNNAGLLRKSASNGSTSIAVPVTNSGTVTTLQGTLNFNSGGSLGGSYNAAAGSLINFNSGAFTYPFNALPQLNGPGGTRFTGGTLTLIDNPIPNLALLGGTLTLSPNFQGGTITNLATGSTLGGNYSVSGILSLSNGASGGLQLLSGSIVNWSGGDLGGSSQVSAGAVLNWSGGTLLGPFTVATNGALNLVGSGNKFLENALTNAGSIAFGGSGDLYFYNNLGTYKGAIYNLAGALFDIQADRNFNCGCYGSELFNNAGLLRKSASNGSTSIAVPVTNSGTVTTLQGTLNFNSGGSLAGSYNAAAGSLINFNSGAFTYQFNALPQLNGPGGTRFTGGTLTLIDNPIPNLALVGGILTLSPNFQGGTITNLATGSTLGGNYSVSGILNASNGVSGGLQLLSGSVVNWSGGDLGGGSQVSAGAVLNWSAGELLGPLTVATNGVLNLVGSGNKFLESALTNAGSIAFGGSGDLYFYNNLGTYKGAVYNLAGALFDIQADRNLNCACYGSELFDNAGLLRKSAGTGTTSIAVHVHNSGTLDVESGTVNFNFGSGYAQTGATMTFGVSATNSAGHANFAGAVNFDGTIAITPLNGYAPQNGDVLSLISYGSGAGTFNNLNLPPLSPGLGWQTLYNATALQLKVVPNGAVDGPYPDLAVTDVRAPAIAGAGQTVQVVWTDTNIGNAPATNAWNDQLFLSNTSIPGGGRFLGAFTITKILAPAQSLTLTQTVTIPQFATGTNWFIVKGNAGNGFYELNSANNTSVATQGMNVASSLALQLSPGIVSESAGTNVVAGSVTRNGDVSASLTVNLASATGTNVFVPATLVIPAGKYSVNFRVSVLDNAVAGGFFTETISASAAGFTAVDAPLKILFDDSQELTLTLSTNQVPENAAAGAATGTITRNVNLGAALQVVLMSDLPTALTAPASVTIPAGQASVSFSLAPVNDFVVGDTRRARISAKASGYNPVTATIDVLNADASQLTLSLADASVSKGQANPATIGTVMRSVVSPAAQDVFLSVTNNSLVTAPAVVTIPANSAGVTFNVSVGDDHLSTGTQIATLTARMLTPSRIIVTNGQTSATLKVLDTHGASLSLSFTDSSIAKGSNTVGTVTRNTTTATNLTVDLVASPAAAVSFPDKVIIPPGQTGATFTVTGVLDKAFTGARKVEFNAAASGFNSAVGNLTVSDIYMPDLLPVAINVPTNALTGQAITVSWVVANHGLSAATNSWYDTVSVATDRVGSGQVTLAYVTNKSSLASGASYTNQATFALPSVPGNYWIAISADALNSVIEITRQNNSLVGAVPIAIHPLYSAVITNVTPAVAKSGTPVTFTGRTYFTADGSPAPLKNATIHLLLDGARRLFNVRSDTDGNFSYTFQPLSVEAGDYTVGADYPLLQADPAQAGFALLGIQALPAGLTAQLLPNVPLTNQLVLSNLTAHPLTGLSFAVPDLGSNLSAQFIFTNQALPAHGEVTVSCVFQSPITRSAQIRFSAIANSAEGAQLTIPVSANVVPLVPQLTANPSFLTRGMRVGAQTVIAFDILNTGGASSGDLTVQLPTNFTWMTLSSPALIPSIPAGGKASVTLTLNPPGNLPLTLYTGNLAAVGEQIGVSVPFQFRAVSDGKGDLRVTATDDYTYYVAGAPKVTNAVVTVRDAITTAIIARTNSDANGIAWFIGLPEGPYTVDATAAKHNQFRGSVSVVAGTISELEAFMPRQLVTYQWTVVPTEIPDHYTVQLETVFETEVPVPNIVVEEPSVMLLVAPGQISQFDIKLTNQGLIAANGVSIHVPDDPNYIITPLVKDIGVIPAKSSVTVPVTVQSRAAPAAMGRIGKMDAGGCDTTQIGFHGCLPNIPLGVEYYYACGPNNVLQQRSVDLSVACTAKSIYDCLKDLKGITESENLRSLGCSTLTAFLSCAASQYGINLDPCVVMGLNIACGAATEGAAGAVSGGLGSLPDCICAHLDLIPLPSFPHATPTGSGGDLLLPILPTGGYSVCGSSTATGILIPGGNCGGSGPSPASLKTTSQVSAHSNPLKLRAPIKTASAGVCARVRLRIDQNVIITRSAFQGTLEIDNGGSANISNVQISLNFQDSTNGNAAGKFFIEGPALSGLTAADGTGVLAGGSTGSAVYTFIPTVDAAPDAPQSFQIGGTLSYNDNGEQVIVPLLSAPITVYPEARLNLVYFQQRDVFGDDPFTAQIEPSEPFALGLIVKNTGAGNAHDLTITSGQPRIVDNDKGLLIDFTILGTEVGDQPVSPSLTARLGDISPGGTREVTWDMISSLQGRFISFNASFKHANELGGTNTSIINSVEIHELTHRVLANRPGDDNLPDFLVNDIADPENLPDILYLSDGTVAPINVSTTATVDAPAGPGHLQVQLAASVSNGWNYIQVPNPGAGYVLRQVVRSDGRIISLTNNAWITDRTFPSSITGAIQENLLHLFDYAGNGSYSLYYASTNTTPPAIVQVVGPVPFTQSGAVSSVDVIFSALINTNSFSYTNVSLVRNGGGNLITSAAGISLSLVSNFTYSIKGLQTLTAADGNYQITVGGNGIYDLWGNNAGNVSASAAWAKGNAPVVVQSLAPVSPNPRNVPLNSATVTFSRAIDAATFDYTDISLTRDGGANLVNNSVQVAQVSPTTFTIGGLGALSGAEGSYTLEVNATHINDTLGTGGFGAQSVSWTMITSSPKISALEQIATNPRNIVVQSLTVTFSGPIDPATFDYHDLALTRDGGPNLITSDVTVSQVSPSVYKIANFNWAQGLAGTYTFTVNANNIADLAGNTGSGSTNETWTLLLAVPPSPANLVMTPDLGISATDGLTSATTVSMAGSVGASNMTVRVVDLTTASDLGAATVNGTHFSQTLTFTITGHHQLKFTAVDLAGNVSVPAYFDLFLDILPPTAIIQKVANPVYSGVSTIPVLFSEPIDLNSLSSNNFVLTRDGTSSMTPTLTHVATNLFLLGGISTFTDPLGNYQLRLNLAGIQDLAGNSSATTITMGWVRGSTNVAPSMALITNRVVTPDGLVRFKVIANDANGDPLTFSLDPGAPATATINPTNGIFAWAPTRAFASTTNPITIRVTDNGNPSMSTTQAVLVTVLDYLDLSLGSTNVEGGQSVDVPVYLASSEGVTNLTFNILWPGARLTNTFLAITAPEIASSLLQDQVTNLLITLRTAPGQVLQGTQQQILKLTSSAVASQTSAFLPLSFGLVDGIKRGNIAYSNYVVHPASVAVIQDRPLLMSGFRTNNQRNLTLLGRLNQRYVLQYSTNLSGAWYPLSDYIQTSNAISVRVDSSNPVIFYRLYQP